MKGAPASMSGYIDVGRLARAARERVSGSAGATSISYYFGEIGVSGSERPASQLFDDITKEARRRAHSTLGINRRPHQMLDF